MLVSDFSILLAQELLVNNRMYRCLDAIVSANIAATNRSRRRYVRISKSTTVGLRDPLGNKGHVDTVPPD